MFPLRTRRPEYADEHRISQANRTTEHSDGPAPLRASRVENRSSPLTAPSKEHDSKHATIADYLTSPNYSESGRRQQPTPQRSQGDGSGRAYTKSPDYVDGYKKTAKYWRPKDVAKESEELA